METVRVCQPKNNVCAACLSQRLTEKDVRCITLSSGFQANCLDIDVLETSFYEYKEIHGPPKEDEEIHE